MHGELLASFSIDLELERARERVALGLTVPAIDARCLEFLDTMFCHGVCGQVKEQAHRPANVGRLKTGKPLPPQPPDSMPNGRHLEQEGWVVTRITGGMFRTTKRWPVYYYENRAL